MRSLVKRAMSTWHSGSPKRMLCSKSLTLPSLVIIKPAKMTPVNGSPPPPCHPPSLDDVSHHLVRDLRSDDRGGGVRAHTTRVQAGVAISHALVVLRARERHRLTAADDGENEASSPSKNSSTTISSPALPKSAPLSMSSTAFKALSSSRATMTPLPAAKPSVLTTMGAPLDLMYSSPPRRR